MSRPGRLGFRLVLAGCVLALPAAGFGHGFGSTTIAKSAFVGEQRYLVVPITWGPQPFTQEEVRRVVFDETAAWMSQASFGLTTLRGDVTPWFTVLRERPNCDTRLIRTLALEAAASAGYDPARFNRFGFVFPRIDCRFAGLAEGEGTFFNGAMYRKLVAHELGHTYGLNHSNTWECSGGTCSAVEYGDPYDTMGNGDGHYNAFEKFSIGWITNVAHAAAPGAYPLERLDVAGVGSKALIVTTARNTYWLDLRLEQLHGPFASAFLPTGVEVHAGPNLAADPAALVFSQDNLLLPDPAGLGRPVLFSGETFREPGAFEVAVASQVGDQAELRFAWTDATAPRPPAIVDPVAKLRPGGTLEVTWLDARELGSGVLYYEVSLDGRKPTRVAVDFRISALARYRKPAPGAHVVRVWAVDRAGNRSAAAVRRFTVLKPAKAKRTQ